MRPIQLLLPALLGAALPSQVEVVTHKDAHSISAILLALTQKDSQVPIYISSDFVMATWFVDATWTVLFAAQTVGERTHAWALEVLRAARGRPDRPGARRLQGIMGTACLLLRRNSLPADLPPDLVAEIAGEVAAVEACGRAPKGYFIDPGRGGWEVARPRGVFAMFDSERTFRAVVYLRLFAASAKDDTAHLLEELSAQPGIAAARAALARQLDPEIELFGPPHDPVVSRDVLPATFFPRTSLPDVRLLHDEPPELVRELRRDPIEALAAAFSAEAAATTLPATARLPVLAKPSEDASMREHVMFAIQRLAAAREAPALLSRWPAGTWAQRRRDVALYAYSALRDIDALATAVLGVTEARADHPVVFVEPVRDVYEAMRNAWRAMDRHGVMQGGRRSPMIDFLDDVLAVLDAQERGGRDDAAGARIWRAAMVDWYSRWPQTTDGLRLPGGKVLRRAPLRGMHVTLAWQGREVRAAGVLAELER